jgi:AcrR family transcriptional regulator
MEQQSSVLEAAVQVLGEKGLDASFIDLVAQQAEVSPASIFVHFGGPTGLIDGLLDKELQIMAGSVPSPELRFPGETLEDELKLLSRIIVEEYRKNMLFMRTMLVEAIRNPEFATVFYRTFILKGRKLFTDFLETRRGVGELREDLDIEAASAFFLCALTFSLLLLEMMQGKTVEQIEDNRLIEGMSDLFLRGVLKSSELEFQPDDSV